MILLGFLYGVYFDKQELTLSINLRDISSYISRLGLIEIPLAIPTRRPFPDDVVDGLLIKLLNMSVFEPMTEY